MDFLEIKQQQLSENTIKDLRNILFWLRNRIKPDSITIAGLRTTRSHASVFCSKKVAYLLKDLNYNYAQFTLSNFATHIASYLARQIQLVPFQLSRSTSGVCIRTTKIDYIFFNEGRHRILQEHIVAHEASHLLLGHQMVKMVLDDQLLQEITEYLRFHEHVPHHGGSIQFVEMQQESEAEAFAREFLSRVQIHRRNQILNSTRNTKLFPPFT